MKTLKLYIKSHIKVENHLYQYLKQNGLIEEFSTLIINLPFKNTYSLNDIIFESTTPSKWINIHNDFNLYLKSKFKKPFGIGNHEFLNIL